MKTGRLSILDVNYVKRIAPLFCGFILTSILFFPAIPIGKGLPAIEIVDLLLPLIGLVVLILRKDFDQKKFILLILVFAAFIFLTMIINNRLPYRSDYFEIYKLIKFSLLICLFAFINPDTFYKFWVKPLFIGLVFFNLIHYFNFFGFNEFLEHVYFGNRNYLEFGLNSAGIPNSKRMMGFTANPNNNAIIFGVFAIIFLPKKELNLKSLLYFGVAVLMMLMCQSRTAMMAFPFILIAYSILSITRKKNILAVIFVSICAIGLAQLVSSLSVGVGTPVNMEMVRKFEKAHPNLHWDEATQTYYTDGPGGTGTTDYTYLESIAHGEFIEGSSMMGRYEIWKHLWQMIKTKPLFGHGPYKEYFYENDLYAENEYIFMAWRYGFIGLAIYLALLGILLVIAFKNRHLDSGWNLILVLILYGITSLTNLPFAAITLNMLFAIMIGVLFADLRLEKRNNQSIR